MFQIRLNRIIVFSMLASLCIVAGCAGFWTSRTDNITTSNFSFVANANFFTSGGSGAGSVSIFTTNPSTGTLTATLSTVSTGGSIANSPVAIVTTAGKYIYTANDGGSVSGFTWDTTTGQLTAISGSPFTTTGSNPTALVVDHTGQFLYVAKSGSNDIDGFTINSSTGALTSITGSPFTLADSPAGLAVHPTLNVLYAAINASGLATFTYDGTTGALTFKNNTAPLVSGTSQAVVISKNGNFAYVANGLAAPNGGIEAWKLDNTGMITAAVTGFTNPIPAHDTPVAMVTDPTGGFLIAVNANSDDISFYSMNTSNGILTTITGSPFNVVTSSSLSPALSNISMDPTGTYVYVTVLDSTPGISGSAGLSIPGVVLFKLSTSSGGSLTKVPVSSSVDGIQAGVNPSGIVLP